MQQLKRFTPEDEAPEGTGAPRLRELVDREVERRRSHSTCGVEGSERQCAKRLHALPDPVDLCFASDISCEGMCLPARCLDLGGHHL